MHTKNSGGLTGANRHSTPSHTYLLAADPVAQAGAEHLLAALCLEPLHAHRVDDAIVGDALAVGLGLRLLRLRLVQRRLHVGDAGGAGAWGTQETCGTQSSAAEGCH